MSNSVSSVKKAYEAIIEQRMSTDQWKVVSAPDLTGAMKVGGKTTKIPAGGFDGRTPAGKVVVKDYYIKGELYEDQASQTGKGRLTHAWFDCGAAPKLK